MRFLLGLMFILVQSKVLKVDSEDEVEWCDVSFSKGLDYASIPEQHIEVCPIEQSNDKDFIRSRDAGQAQRVFMLNNASVPVSLFWVNHEGDELFVDDIPPRSPYSVQTFEGHVFTAREQASGHVSIGRLLARYTVGQLVFRNPKGLPCTSPDTVLPPWEPMPTREMPDKLECGFVHTGFSNAAGCEIELWYLNQTTKEIELKAQLGLRSVPTGMEYDDTWGTKHHYENTYLSHVFYAKTREGTLLDSKQIKRFVINACPQRLGMPGAAGVFIPGLLHTVSHAINISLVNTTVKAINLATGQKENETNSVGYHIAVQGKAAASGVCLL